MQIELSARCGDEVESELAITDRLMELNEIPGYDVGRTTLGGPIYLAPMLQIKRKREREKEEREKGERGRGEGEKEKEKAVSPYRS